MKELVEYIARSLVDDPGSVKVTEVEVQGVTEMELSVAPDDMGRVIGRGGRVANAIRALARVVAAREGKRVNLEID